MRQFFFLKNSLKIPYTGKVVVTGDFYFVSKFAHSNYVLLPGGKKLKKPHH